MYLPCPGGIQQSVLTACSAVWLHREPLVLWGQGLSDFLTAEMNKWKDLSNVSVDFPDHFSTTLQLPVDQHPAKGLAHLELLFSVLSLLFLSLHCSGVWSSPIPSLLLNYSCSYRAFSDQMFFFSSFLFSVVVCFVSACARFLVCILFPLLALISVPLGCPITAVPIHSDSPLFSCLSAGPLSPFHCIPVYKPDYGCWWLFFFCAVLFPIWEIG